MTGNDIRDILQISKPTDTGKKFKQQEKERKPDGISRELFSLIGGAPPLSLVKPAYKAKPNLKKKAVSWVWHAFTNPAREDNLILHHWVKGSEDESEEYRFAKFNKVIDMVEYTDEEYNKYLTDPQWSREETDYLFDLCRRFDLRFVMVTDRYEFPGKNRSMEDLKDRYYDVNRKLLKARSPTPGDISQERAALINQYTYDKAREIERKKNLSVLFNRTPEQIEEEEALYIESRRIEQNEKKLAKEREGLLKFLQTYEISQTGPLASPGLAGMGMGGQAGVSPGMINIPGGPGGGGLVSPIGMDKKKKKLSKSEATTPTTEGPGIGLQNFGESSKKARRSSNASVSSNATVSDIAKGEIMSPIESFMVEKKEKLVPGVFVRSQKITAVKPNMVMKVSKFMDELGIAPRPVMPTSQVCAKFEHLQSSILTLQDLKKVADKLEHELKVKRLQKAKESGAAGADAGEGSSTAVAGGSVTAAGATTPAGVRRSSSTVGNTTPRETKRARK